MNKRIYLIILLLTCRICNAQNLVPNGDFEQYSNCPTTISQFQGYVNDWINPNVGAASGTPDYYNACSGGNVSVPSNLFGSQQAFSGVAYFGIVIARELNNQNFREYAEIMLTSPLTANVCYHFQMYMNLGDSSGYTSDNIGVYFSTIAITGITSVGPLPFIPQIQNTSGNYPDNTSWIKVMGDYTANGNESYLIIGNFYDSTSTNAVLFNSAATKPVAYVYIDSVSLNICTTGINEQHQENSINVFPSPATDKLNVSFNNNESCEIIIYDITTRRLLQKSFTGTISINIESLAKGAYIYEIRNKKGVIKKGKVVKE